MDQKSKTKATSEPSLQPQPRRRWLNRTKTFFNVPNPRITKIFLISSFAMLFSGIGFAFEWTFHGKKHAGFQWVIYYALSLIFLPALIWLGLGTIIAVPSSHGAMQVASLAAEEEEQCVNGSACKGGHEETEDNDRRSLAVVVDSDKKKCTEMVFEDKISKLKRTVSYPVHSQVRSCRTR